MLPIKQCSASRDWRWSLRLTLLLAACLVVRTLGVQAQLDSQPTVQTEATAKSTEYVPAYMRSIYPSEWGASYPAGVAYSEQRNLFFVLANDPAEAASGQTTVIVLSPDERLVSSTSFTFTVGDAINIAFDDSGERLLLLGGSPLQLVQVKMDANGLLDPASVTHLDATRFGLHPEGTRPAGMTIDQHNHFLWILDGANAHVVRIALQEALDTAAVTTFDLAAAGLSGLRGIAVHPATHHLFVMSPSQKLLYELTDNFQLLTHYDIAPLDLVNPQALVFANSPDPTDEAQAVHLFIADSNLPATGEIDQPSLIWLTFLPIVFQTEGEPASLATTTAANVVTPGEHFGRIVELNLTASNDASVTAADTNVANLVLIQTIHTSAFSPPSPDPSGITYVATTNRIIASDGEVDEMPIFANRNLFGFTLPASALSFSGRTTPYSNEPTDIAFNPTNQRYFISDDNLRRIFEINTSNGILGDSDDQSTSISTAAFGSLDPEGLDYDPLANLLWIADGLGNEVYRVSPGPDGLFNGVDVVTHFDTARSAILDPEGIDFDPVSGHLFMTGNDTILFYELTTNGLLLRTYDMSAAGALKPAGIVLAPGSNNASQTHFWLADRGIDNNVVPTENDGKIYEFALAGTPPPPPTPLPTGSILVGAQSSGVVSGTGGSGVTYANEDILRFNPATNRFALFLDGSDIGLSATDVRGFELVADGSVLLNFGSAITLTGLGLVENRDIVRFIPTATGATTAGTLHWYFDGSDVNLPSTSRGIDALHRLEDGRLLLSTESGAAVGATNLVIADEDLVAFTFLSSPGDTISGTWELYFDGSDVGLSNGGDSEDIDEVWVNPANNEIYLTTRGNFAVSGVSGGLDDIFVCRPGTLGIITTCTYRFFWDGAAFGLNQQLDSLGLNLATAQAAQAEILAAEPDVTVDAPLIGAPLGNEEVAATQPEEEAAPPGYQLFLPLIDNTSEDD